MALPSQLLQKKIIILKMEASSNLIVSSGHGEAEKSLGHCIKHVQIICEPKCSLVCACGVS
jgi:hypothetical protein